MSNKSEEKSKSSISKGLEALRAIQKEAVRNGTAGMSLEEINAEIAASRKNHVLAFQPQK